MATDFYKFDELYTDDQLAIRDEVRKFVDSVILPNIGDWADQGIFPKEKIVPTLGELGVLGCVYPEQYGCAGVDNQTYGLIMQELERGDTGLRSFASVQSSLVMYPIFDFGSEAHRTHYLPKLAKAEMIGCFGLTEPYGGRNPGAMKTRAVDKGDHWLLNGEKMWITNGSIADIAIVFAQTGAALRLFPMSRPSSRRAMWASAA
ncbi:MAG: acyl-CoA dehydrogenase family protein [Planctomycetota bacterium]